MKRIRSTNQLFSNDAFAADTRAARRASSVLAGVRNPFGEASVASARPSSGRSSIAIARSATTARSSRAASTSRRSGRDNVAQHAERLEMAVRKLRGHAMPPPKEPRPDEQRLMSFVALARGRARRGGRVERTAIQPIVPHR